MDQYDIELYLDKMNAHGFLVEGVKHPFIELFCYPRFCVSYCKKAVRAWLSESSSSNEQRISNPEDLRMVDWELSEAFGLEMHGFPGAIDWSPDPKQTGQLVHMFWGAMS